jgi:hypothetical protein
MAHGIDPVIGPENGRKPRLEVERRLRGSAYDVHGKCGGAGCGSRMNLRFQR